MFDMLVFNCSVCIFSFYYRIRVIWNKMESHSNSDVVIVDDENDTAKRVYTSVGDTPGKPNNKTRRLSHMRNPTST